MKPNDNIKAVWSHYLNYRKLKAIDKFSMLYFIYFLIICGVTLTFFKMLFLLLQASSCLIFSNNERNKI